MINQVDWNNDRIQNILIDYVNRQIKAHKVVDEITTTCLQPQPLKHLLIIKHKNTSCEIELDYKNPSVIFEEVDNFLIRFSTNKDEFEKIRKNIIKYLNLKIKEHNIESEYDLNIFNLEDNKIGILLHFSQPKYKWRLLSFILDRDNYKEHIDDFTNSLVNEIKPSEWVSIKTLLKNKK